MRVTRAPGPGSCVRAVFLAYPTGRVRYVVVGCGRWACEDCAPAKINTVVMHAKEVSGGVPLYAGEVAPDRWEAARKMVDRKADGWFKARRPNDTVCLVTDTPLEGRGWAVEAPTDGDLTQVLRRRPIKRVNWCRAWQPPKRDPKGTTREPVPPSWVPELTRRIGYDPTRMVIPDVDPAEAGRLIKATAAEMREEGYAPSTKVSTLRKGA